MSNQDKKISPPVIIVAGGCDPEMENEIAEYRNILVAAFEDFEGTIISGGTSSGVSGLVGDIQARYSPQIYSIGYLPESQKSPGSIADKRYSELRYSSGESDFSLIEPLNAWTDIISSGIAPSQVKLLGINGGAISAVEYKIALALGATVALIEGSGREAGKLLKEDDWNDSAQLSVLPKDAKKIKKFLMV